MAARKNPISLLEKLERLYYEGYNLVSVVRTNNNNMTFEFSRTTEDVLFDESVLIETHESAYDVVKWKWGKLSEK